MHSRRTRWWWMDGQMQKADFKIHFISKWSGIRMLHLYIFITRYLWQWWLMLLTHNILSQPYLLYGAATKNVLNAENTCFLGLTNMIMWWCWMNIWPTGHNRITWKIPDVTLHLDAITRSWLVGWLPLTFFTDHELFLVYKSSWRLKTTILA